MKTRVQASAWYILIHNGIQKWGVAHDRDYIGVPKPVAIMSLLKWQASAYLVSADSSVWSIPPLACLSRDDWPSCMMVHNYSCVTLDPKIKETAQTLNQIKFERALVKAPVCFSVL